MEWCDEQVQIVSPVSCILIITVSWQSLCTSSSVSGNLQQERRSSSPKAQVWSHIIPAEINRVPKKFGAAQTHTEVCKQELLIGWAIFWELGTLVWELPAADALSRGWRGRNVTRSAGHGDLQSRLSPSQGPGLQGGEERFWSHSTGVQGWCFALSMLSSANIFIEHPWDTGLLSWSGCLSNTSKLLIKSVTTTPKSHQWGEGMHCCCHWRRVLWPSMSADFFQLLKFYVPL